MPITGDERQARADKFAAEVERILERRKLTPAQIEVTFHDGDVEVPGFVAMSTPTPLGTIRGWVHQDGTVIIPQRTPLVPLLEAMGFADEPPPIDDDRLAHILAWGYGEEYELLTRVEKGDLGMKAELWCPPVRERRASDGAIVFRYVMRLKDDEDPAILALAVARTPDGKYRFDNWQLAPKDEDDEDDDEED